MGRLVTPLTISVAETFHGSNLENLEDTRTRKPNPAEIETRSGASQFLRRYDLIRGLPQGQKPRPQLGLWRC